MNVKGILVVAVIALAAVWAYNMFSKDGIGALGKKSA